MTFDKKNLVTVIAALGISAILVLGLKLDPVGFIVPERESGESQPAPATATVTRVVDGDTIDVRIASSSDTVRLIGVDAPEIRWPNEENNLDEPKEKGCFALDSWRWLQEKVKDRKVRLVGDGIQPTRDKYDRRLAYVYLDDELVNKSLLQQGYAKQIVVGNGYDKQESFLQAEITAREKGEGLWGNCE